MCRGWRRIAILLSAVWMVGGSLYISGLITDRAAMMGGFASDACEAKATREHRPFSDCGEAFGVAFSADLRGAASRKPASQFSTARCLLSASFSLVGWCSVLYAPSWRGCAEASRPTPGGPDPIWRA
jgi:hypothetical protein